jgi:hypothetical protein
MSELSRRRPPKSIAIVRLSARFNLLARMPVLMLATFAFVAPPALARDPASLADLSVPANRVPDWRHLDYLPLDTSTWTQTSVPCNGGDHNALRDAFDAAEPNTVLIIAANCTYRFSSRFVMDKSNIVIRGTSRDTSIIEYSNRNSDMFMMSIASFPAPEPFGGARNWTAGYVTGSEILTVANTTGLVVGGWVRMSANPEADWHSKARNQYTAKLLCVGTTGGAECAGLSAKQIKIDNPLPSPYHQGNQRVQHMTSDEFLSNVGIENLRFQHTTPNTVQKYRQYVKLKDCFECWIVDSSFGDVGNRHIGTSDIVRTVFRGNDFGSNQCHNDGKTCLWNKGAIYLNHGNSDVVFENNSLTESPSGPLAQGGAGHVIAYNFRTSSAAVECERHVFLHGQGVTATLVEGNDVDCGMQWDSYRDGQGYNNMFYRNRLRGERSPSGYQRGRLGGEDTGSHIHRFITVIANHVNELMGSPQPEGRAIDNSVNATHHHQDTWVSYNIARNEIRFSKSGNEVRTTQHQNFVRQNPSPTWSAVRFPTSMYRPETPSWWCEESGSYPNIGGPSDAVGSYSRLPAQIRIEGGVCTTSGGVVVPPVRPDPPVIQ